MEEQNNTSTSEFNSALTQLMRLQSYWGECNRYSMNGQFDKWRFKLDIIWRELYCDAMEFDSGKQTKDYISFKTKIINADKEISDNMKNRQCLYKSLIKKELILRELEDKSGKGSKRSDYDFNIM